MVKKKRKTQGKRRTIEVGGEEEIKRILGELDLDLVDQIVIAEVQPDWTEFKQVPDKMLFTRGDSNLSALLPRVANSRYEVLLYSCNALGVVVSDFDAQIIDIKDWEKHEEEARSDGLFIDTRWKKLPDDAVMVVRGTRYKPVGKSIWDEVQMGSSLSKLDGITMNRMGRGEMIWMSIKRHDRDVINDWRELMRIKNEVVGEHLEAVQLFPSMDRVVDTSNQYHLWVRPNWEFGFTKKSVMDKERAAQDEAKQAPLPDWLKSHQTDEAILGKDDVVAGALIDKDELEKMKGGPSGVH